MTEPALDAQESVFRGDRSCDPVLSGAAHELIDIAMSSSDVEVRKGCKEALNSTILGPAIVADLEQINSKQ